MQDGHTPAYVHTTRTHALAQIGVQCSAHEQHANREREREQEREQERKQERERSLAQDHDAQKFQHPRVRRAEMLFVILLGLACAALGIHAYNPGLYFGTELPTPPY